MQLLRKTRIPHWYEYYRTPCPICGHVGGCMVNEKGDRVACIRVESERYFSKNSALPSYLHILTKNKQKVEIDDVDEYQDTYKSDDSTLDYVYRAFLEYLELTDSHYQHLVSPKRELSDKQIVIRQYSSFPERPWEIVKMLSEDYGITDFRGIPGFYLKDNKYWTIAGKTSILIPYRNHYNQIVGFQYRIDHPPNVVEIKSNRQGWKAVIKEQPDLVQVLLDGQVIFEKHVPLSKKWTNIIHDGEMLGWVRVAKGQRYYWLSSANKPQGTGSGNPSPIHVAVPISILKKWKSGTLQKAKTVWLTEGPLKADISSDLVEKYYDSSQQRKIGTTFLSLPGVGAWRLALPVMKEMGVENVNLCFDADALSNPQVKKHLIECAKFLKAQGYKGSLVIWNESEGKGIDDLLNNKKLPHIKKLF